MNYSSWLGRVYRIQFFFLYRKNILFLTILLFFFFMTRTFIGYLTPYCTGVRRCLKFWTFHRPRACVYHAHCTHKHTCMWYITVYDVVRYPWMLLFFPEKLFVAGKRDVRANSVHCGRRGVTAEGGSDGIFLYDTRRMPTFVLFPVYYKYFSYIHENTRVFIYSFTGYIYI